MNAPAHSPAFGRSPLLAPLVRRRFLVVSLACHAVLLGLVYRAAPYRVHEQPRDPGAQARVERSLERTAQAEMRRQLRSMEEISKLLKQSAGEEPAGQDKAGSERQSAREPAKPDDVLAKAKQLAKEIHATGQRIKAAELARLLHIPEKKALEKVRAEEAARPRVAAAPVTPLPHAMAMAQLEAQAKAALAQRQRQLAAESQGVPLNGRAGTDSAAIGGRLDALASGLGLDQRQAVRGSSLDMASDTFSDQRHFGAYLAPPALDLTRLRTGAGRKLGAGGPYANRIFLNSWYIIGPFQGMSAASIDEVYPPERGVDLDAVYFGKNRRLLKWTYQADSAYPTVPMPRAENAVYYAWTEVEVDRDRDLWMSIGADDDSKLWFNERLVWVGGDGDKPWYRTPFYRLHDEVAHLNLAEGQRKLHFHKGRNSILLKLYNGIDLMFFSVVLSPGRD